MPCLGAVVHRCAVASRLSATAVASTRSRGEQTMHVIALHSSVLFCGGEYPEVLVDRLSVCCCSEVFMFLVFARPRSKPRRGFAAKMLQTTSLNEHGCPRKIDSTSNSGCSPPLWSNIPNLPHPLPATTPSTRATSLARHHPPPLPLPARG
jgi:hypothetical protein